MNQEEKTSMQDSGIPFAVTRPLADMAIPDYELPAHRLSVPSEDSMDDKASAGILLPRQAEALSGASAGRLWAEDMVGEAVASPEALLVFEPSGGPALALGQAESDRLLAGWEASCDEGRPGVPTRSAGLSPERVSALAAGYETDFAADGSASASEAVRSALSDDGTRRDSTAVAGEPDKLEGTTGDDRLTLASDGTWGTYHVARWNGGTAFKVSLAGRNRFYDVVAGNGGYDRLFLPEGDNALLFSDRLSKTPDGADGSARFTGIEEIVGNSGDDLIDLTAAGGGTSEGVLIKGGDGNDHLWGGNGSDVFFGDKGNDDLRGGQGEDIYLFGVNWGQDTVIDNGGYLIFDSSFQNKLALTQISGGTHISAGSNSVDLNWYIGQDDIYYADVQELYGYTSELIKQVVETEVLPPDVNPDF